MPRILKARTRQEAATRDSLVSTFREYSIRLNSRMYLIAGTSPMIKYYNFFRFLRLYFGLLLSLPIVS
jgi:hypothetical protein